MATHAELLTTHHGYLYSLPFQPLALCGPPFWSHAWIANNCNPPEGRIGHNYLGQQLQSTQGQSHIDHAHDGATLGLVHYRILVHYRGLVHYPVHYRGALHCCLVSALAQYACQYPIVDWEWWACFVVAGCFVVERLSLAAE